MNTSEQKGVTMQIALDTLNDSILQEILQNWNFEECEINIHPRHLEYKNLIYFVTKKDKDYVLRISFRADRPLEQIQAETNFIEYLVHEKVAVAHPIKSKNGSFVVPLKYPDFTLYAVLFIKARGFCFLDHQAQNKKGISLDEYYHHFGKTIGLLHRLTSHFVQPPRMEKRPDLMNNIENVMIPKYLPEKLSIVKEKFIKLINETKRLPKDLKCYGLIHTDFSDENFVINFDTGNLSIFDFDDLAYSWFMYDLAVAWTKGIKTARVESNHEQKTVIVNDNFDKIMGGYATENNLSKYWLSKLEFFVKIVEMNELLKFFQRQILNDREIVYDSEITHRIDCIEKDNSYYGLRDSH